MSIYHLWQVMIPKMDPTLHQDVHLAFALSLVFLSAMNVKESDKPGRALISQLVSLFFLRNSLLSRQNLCSLPKKLRLSPLTAVFQKEFLLLTTKSSLKRPWLLVCLAL